MTNLILIAVPFIGGLAIGGGGVMMWINQRKIPLDKWTESFHVSEDDLVGQDDNPRPIAILDTEYGNAMVCQVMQLDQEPNERVQQARWIENALNRHRG